MSGNSATGKTSISFTRGRERHACGFTLLELMVTLAVAAILLTIAVPSFHHILTATNLANVNNDLAGDLQYARTQAVTRQVNVAVDASSGDWQNGWRVEIPPASTAPGATPEVLRRHPLVSSQYVVSAGTVSLIYKPQGSLNLPGTVTSVCFTISALHGEHNTPHFLQVFPAGMLQQTSHTTTPPTGCPAPPP